MKARKKGWQEKQFIRHRRHNVLHARQGVHRCVIVLDNLKASFNVGKIFRTADALGMREIHLIGTDYFPTTSAKGSFKWVPAFFHTDYSTCHDELSRRGYTVYLFEASAESMLHTLVLAKRSCFIFGHEERGVTFQKEHYGNIVPVRIPQFGRVQSLNVSIAASIAMYEYLRQHPV